MRILFFCLLLILPSCSAPVAPDGPAIMSAYGKALESEDLAALEKIMVFSADNKSDALAVYKQRFVAIDDFKVSFENVKTVLDEDNKSAEISFAIDSSWQQQKSQKDLQVGVELIDGEWKLYFVEISGIKSHVSGRLDGKGYHLAAAGVAQKITRLLDNYALLMGKEDVSGTAALLFDHRIELTDIKEYYQAYFKLVENLHWQPQPVKVEIADGTDDQGLISFALEMNWRQSYHNPETGARLVLTEGQWHLLAASVQ